MMRQAMYTLFQSNQITPHSNASEDATPAETERTFTPENWTEALDILQGKEPWPEVVNE